ncbi:odorant receptor 47a-like [Linepithema humile]|uniref:odorant receptor 47a-like n=1 Tax=Linepithema humile TaxID=83485 RepID=UPI00351E74A4
MIDLKTQYFSYNKILLLAVGLWPYQQSKLTRLQFIFLSIILITATIFQFTTFVTLKFYSSTLIVEILSTAISYITFMIKYSSFCVNIDNVKNLMMQLEHIYNKLKDKNEIAIIEKYGYNAKRHTIALTTFFIGAMAMLATGTMLLTFFQHICGMFTLSCYRIERAVKFHVFKNNLNMESLISKGIICAVDIHQQAMKFTNNLMLGFDRWYFCLVIFGVAALSFNLLRVTYIISLENDVTAVLLPLFFASVSIMYMFIANSTGQDIIDHNHCIFFTTYNVPWYSAPLHIQRMILFLLQQATKEFYLTVGGLFNASLECFATLVKASVSYFTVIYSMR